MIYMDRAAASRVAGLGFGNQAPATNDVGLHAGCRPTACQLAT